MLNQSIPSHAGIRQSPIIFVATLSCVMSFWLTLRFFAQLCPGEGYELWAIGALWESAKIVFSTAGLRDWASAHHKTRGAFLLALAAVLAAGSVFASLGFVSAADDRGRQQALAASAQYQRTQQTWQSIQTEIETLSAASQQDMGQGFRTRGLKLLGQIETRRQQSAAVMAEISAMETGHKNAGKSGAAMPESLRLTGQCVLAVMLELIGIAAMTLLAAGRSSPPSTVGPKKATQPPSHPPSIHRVPELRCLSNTPPAAAPVASVAERYEDVRRQVLAAQLRPSYRALQEAFLISQSTAQRYLRRMRQEGVLCRVGRNYAVMHGVVSGGAA